MESHPIRYLRIASSVISALLPTLSALSFRADKLYGPNTTPTQPPAVPRSRTLTLTESPYSFCEARGIGSAALKASTISSVRMKTYWVYIMSNKSRRLYVGFSSKLPYRVFQHKNKFYPDSFTARYGFYMLVWCEPFGNVIRARMREVEIKGWRRAKKLKLILAENPDWADLSREWEEDPGWKLEPEARPRIKRRTPKS
jgi:putative endonuclease